MDMSGTRVISAAPDVVWAALLDAEVLQACVPGCQSMEGSPEEGFNATVVQKVGPVKATFRGAVSFGEMVPLERLVLTGEGKGGAAGFAKGNADVQLSAVEGGTQLDYTVQAKVGGKLAQLGSRIIDGFARKMADQFFERFQEAVEGPRAETEADEAPKKGWFKKLVAGE